MNMDNALQFKDGGTCGILSVYDQSRDHRACLRMFYGIYKINIGICAGNFCILHIFIPPG